MATKSRIPKARAHRAAAMKRQRTENAAPVGSSAAIPVSVRQLRERFGISRKMFARVVGYSERAIADWEADKPLSEACLQRMREMLRLQEALARVMRPDFVRIWLNEPNAAFEGLKPVEIIERGEIDRLWRMIYQLESGMPT